MKKPIAFLMIALTAMTLAAVPASAAALHFSVDFAVMDPNEALTAEDIDAYRIENVKVCEFPGTADGNVLAASVNKLPSYIVYHITASEGNQLQKLSVKSFASVNDWEVDGNPKAGNEFGIYIKETDSFDVNTDTPVKGASGMIGKKNHSWTLDSYVDGMTECYLCIYFLNNSDFMDWVRFYSFDITAKEGAPVVSTETPETSAKPAVTEAPKDTDAPVTAEKTDDTTLPAGSDSGKAAVTTAETGKVTEKTAENDDTGTDSKNKTLAIILIVAAALIAAVVVFMIVKTVSDNRKNKK